jgi:hypothetical protein
MTASSDPARDLARRREVLLARSARLRDELADDVQFVRSGAGLLDRGVALLDRGIGLADRIGSPRRSSLLVPLALAGGLLLVLRRPSRVLRVAARVLAFWPVVRPFVPRVAALIAARRAAAASPRTL